ncbi:MAG: HEAT repeat domain-containing protein [Polyangiaceae bacterium]|nr:HEAT repeat domain-containing protein [Polyangiaceae bacterium]
MAGWLSLAGAAGAAVWPTEPDRVAQHLASPDAAERRAAARELAGLPASLAAPLVKAALADADVEVRLAAAAAAVEHRLEGASDAVVPWLNEADVRLRLAACQVIRPAPSERAAAALGRVLGDGDANVRRAAARALGNATHPDAVLPLLGHLDDAVPEVRSAVVEALARSGDARAVVPLLGKIQDSAPEVRRAVSRALGELGDVRATGSLLLALRDPNLDVRTEALNALGQLGDPSSVLAIAPLVEPPQPPALRRAALAALARVGNDRALGVLASALAYDDEAPGGQTPARDALVTAGRKAVPTLLSALNSARSERTLAAAALALGSLGATEAREPIARALKAGTLPPGPALRALALVGDTSALPSVLELLAHPSPPVRAEARIAAEVLLDPRRPDGRAVDPIAALLFATQTRPDERPALLRLLGRTGSPRAAALVAPFARSTEMPLRLAALDALGSLGPGGGHDRALLEAVGDDDPAVRARAAAALGLSATEATLEELVRRLGSTEEQDRGALATAAASALARTASARVAEHAAALVPLTEGPTRDALLEGLGRTKLAPARAALANAARSPEAADRRKAAEMLAEPADAPLLRALAADADPGVRASALWSLGAAGDASDVDRVARRLTDDSPGAAANAAASLGLLAERLGAAPRATLALCAALRDGRSYVRAASLTSLNLLRARCADGAPERLALVYDPSPVARAAAADLLVATPSSAPERDRAALHRCRHDDPYGSVATRCSPRAPRPKATEEPVTVLVVPDGASRPLPEAPFALRLADGRTRHGLTDRRGAVFERRAPRGPVALGVPAPSTPLRQTPSSREPKPPTQVGGSKHPVNRRSKLAPRWGRAPFVHVRSTTREPRPNEGGALRAEPRCFLTEPRVSTAPDLSRGFRSGSPYRHPLASALRCAP